MAGGLYFVKAELDPCCKVFFEKASELLVGK